MKSYFAVAAVAALLTAACGSDPLHTGPSTVAPAAPMSSGSAGKFSTTGVSCDTGYVGPIRLPISVHETTATFSWLGSDNDVRGYEIEIERYDVTNVWLPALHDVVTRPEAQEYLNSEGTYRVRVRGLFCGDSVGGFTDWVVFSTDGHNSPVAPPIIPPICPSSVEGCGPPPCLLDCGPPPPPPTCSDQSATNYGGSLPCTYPPPPPPQCNEDEHLSDGECVPNHNDDDDHGGGDHNPPPPPPPFENVTFCHVESHHSHGHTTFTSQTLIAHNQHELDAHFPHHENDYLGACHND